MIIPSWLGLARRHIGLKEIEGKIHNDEIIKFWDDAKIKLRVVDDETPWCAAFVGAMLERSDYRGSWSGRARSYAEMPARFKPCQPTLGCITVLSSDRGALSGHVGFLVSASADGASLGILGGNQNNRVSEAIFPGRKLVGHFWPVSAPDPERYGPPPITISKPTGVSDQ